MNLYFTLASYAVAAASGFAVAWQLQAGTISDIHLEAAHELLQSQADARDEAERRIAQVTAAQNSAQTRLRAVVADRGRADLVGNGLRITTAETVRTAAENPAACADHAATLGIVFDQCVQAYIDVATDADRWASQAIEQHEAAK